MHICPRHQFSTASSMHICVLHDSHAGNAYIVTYAHHAASALYQGMAGFWGCAVMHASSHQTESVGWLRTYPQQGRLVCMRQAVCAYALQILLCRLAACSFCPNVIAQSSTPGLLLLRVRHNNSDRCETGTREMVEQVVRTHMNFGSSVCGCTGMVEQYGT